ncbi:unnamed protein product [Brassicogethes aeneus]|uniref:Uncharacterized protein n=1 Tax=Brassicogethes aeneus TaxID=1431903 RepID=A0A9P0B004_BRAAE|nr:unnamed protein product [Brassicogethes aeneus]
MTSGTVFIPIPIVSIIIIILCCWCCCRRKKHVTYIHQQQQQQQQQQQTVVVMNNTSAPQPMVHPQAEYPSAPRPYDYGLGQHMHQSGPSHAYGFMSPDPHSGSRHLPPQYTATVHEKW